MVKVKNLHDSIRRLMVAGIPVLFKPHEIKEVKHFNGTGGFEIVKEKKENKKIIKEVNEDDLQ